ncbi:hypothetical protein, partial [Ollibium composti]|uniref:hypothetical protein n=1 Tax=Ollibium composti TaxID=2675109 RepID=UPI00197CDADA
MAFRPLRGPLFTPYGYYGPCALDERCKPSAGGGANAGIVSCGEAERTGTEIAGRRSSDRSYQTFGSVSTTAVFPTSTHRGLFFDNGQTEEIPGVA